MLDDALRTAREALDDIGKAKHLYHEFLDDVRQQRSRLEQQEHELRKTADGVVKDILDPAEASLAEILEIKQSLQNALSQPEKAGSPTLVATTARLQAELEMGKERIKRLQREKEDAEARHASALQRQDQRARQAAENIQARHAMDEDELAGLRSDLEALREEIRLVRTDRDRFRTLLGSNRAATEDESG